MGRLFYTSTEKGASRTIVLTGETYKETLSYKMDAHLFAGLKLSFSKILGGEMHKTISLVEAEDTQDHEP